MNTKIVELNPSDILLLEKNARFMRHDTYQRLVNNIREDGALTSTPFCWLNRERGGIEVLSGNHRVKASIEAGLEAINVMLTEDELTEDERIAIQLSHNALAGEDDPAVLKELYESIGDLDHKLYAGLDDRTLELLDSINPETMAEARLRFANLSFVMLPHELDDMRQIWQEAASLAGGSDEKWLAEIADYDQFLEQMDIAASAHGVLNMATSLRILTKLVEANLEQLADGFMDREVDNGDWVPLATVFGTNRIPAPLAKKVRKAVERAKGSAEFDHGWEILNEVG